MITVTVIANQTLFRRLFVSNAIAATLYLLLFTSRVSSYRKVISTVKAKSTQRSTASDFQLQEIKIVYLFSMSHLEAGLLGAVQY